jgi:hypothetical protein
MGRRLTVLHHDNCFDGMASSVVFSRLYRAVADADAQIKYRGVHHRVGDPFEPRWFDGEDNAVLDFRYTRDPRLTWWFDHHKSAFPTPDDEAHFRADASGRKFFDPAARSCTKFIARVARERFGVDMPELGELIEWAEIIDSAGFADARTAVELEHPALRLMTVIEANRDRAFIRGLIDALGRKPLAEVAAARDVAERRAPLLDRHRRAIDVLRARSTLEGGVVSYDVVEDGLDAVNKFIVYYLHPGCRYTVGVSRTDTRVKVSVGSNPWGTVARTHDVARICERYGGGGHAVVGAISLPPDAVAKARQAAREIADELRGGPQARPLSAP